MNRICLGPYSTAKVFVPIMAAALDELYHVRPGRGLIPAVDAIVTNDPGLLFSKKYGSSTLVET